MGGRGHCRECQRDYYLDNRANHIANVAVRRRRCRAETREAINAYLIEHPCVDCGETDLDVLEFDHVRGEKFMEISRMAAMGFSLDAIMAEIAKCEVRCANDHRRVTRRRRLRSSAVEQAPSKGMAGRSNLSGGTTGV